MMIMAMIMILIIIIIIIIVIIINFCTIYQCFKSSDRLSLKSKRPDIGKDKGKYLFNNKIWLFFNWTAVITGEIKSRFANF